jgi:hypothetical protein
LRFKEAGDITLFIKQSMLLKKLEIVFSLQQQIMGSEWTPLTSHRFEQDQHCHGLLPQLN